MLDDIVIISGKVVLVIFFVLVSIIMLLGTYNILMEF